MDSGGHYVGSGTEIEIQSGECPPNQHLVQHSARPIEKGTGQGPSDLAQGVTIHLQHNRLTDVMFVDLLPLEEGSNVTVIDIGEEIGFPGQIQVRVDNERQIFYGLTIQNYSGFRRKILWQYRMWSMQRAITLLVYTLIAGLGIDRRSTPRRPLMSY